MPSSRAYFGTVSVYDDDGFFTRERAHTWKAHFVQCYKMIYKNIVGKIEQPDDVLITMNTELLEESVVDAIIGMKKVVSSENNGVEEPNAFKVAAYLSYWFLRHKPVNVNLRDRFNLMDSITLKDQPEEPEAAEFARKRKVWDIKHVNELVAVSAAMTYVFDFETLVCKKKSHSRVMKENAGKFTHESFDAMNQDALDKLTYYFAYRTIAPKVIEQLLEAYAYHPAWKLTGNH